MLGALLVIYAFIAFLIGLGIFSMSTSVLHEMLAGILLVISSIFFTGAHIIAAIGSSKTKHIELLTQIKDELRKLRLGKYPDDIKKPNDKK